MKSGTIADINFFPKIYKLNISNWLTYHFFYTFARHFKNLLLFCLDWHSEGKKVLENF